jgi:4-amino-4-deoxy-L-arabinose transferase-like glycosyltransferase
MTIHGSRHRLSTDSLFLFLLLAAAGFCAFFRLGYDTIHEWDEARHGQIALEMMQRHDYLRYTFGGQPEQWFSKPPLALWSIVVSYRLFGFNTFALRFPSALAAFLLVWVTYALARLFAPKRVALLCGFIMVASRGVFGDHVGRTGDTDALLILTQLGCVYCALRFLDSDSRPRWLIWAGVFLALSFLTKGAACLTLPAGVLLYVLVTRRWRILLRTAAFWAALVLFGSAVAGWFVVSSRYGYRFSGDGLPGTSNWETMIRYDVVRRVFGNVEGHGSQWNPFYVFPALDVLWSPWFYLLLVLLLVTAATRLAARLQRKQPPPAVPAGALSVSLILVLPLSLLLVVMRSKLRWYAAPMLPPCSIALAVLIARWWPRRLALRLVVPVLFGIALVRVLGPMVRPQQDPTGRMLRENLAGLQKSSGILAVGELRQDYRLALSWSGRPLEVWSEGAAPGSTPSRPLPSGTVLFGRNEDLGRFPGAQQIAQAGVSALRVIP